MLTVQLTVAESVTSALQRTRGAAPGVVIAVPAFVPSPILTQLERTLLKRSGSAPGD
jgi:hypothetical protein